MSIDQYEYIECPGSSGIRIPICKRTRGEEEDRTGAHIPDWMVHIDDADTMSTLDGYEDYTELMGWYCESSRHVKGDSVNNLYTAGTLWHSDVFLVMENGRQNAYINRSVADGTITPNIKIVRLTHINSEVHAIQTLVFSTCHWAGVHTHMDWTIARFTACQRSNTVQAFTQNGTLKGSALCEVDYETNEVDSQTLEISSN